MPPLNPATAVRDLRNGAALVGNIWYVDTINGRDSNTGRSAGSAGALKTMARAFTKISHYDVISIAGVVKEQLVAPVGVFDVSLIGAGTRPRQATDNGVATGGGSCWVSPAAPVAATPLLELVEQGWWIQNILFSPVAASPCIQLTRAETVAHKDPSHATIKGCRFAGGGAGGIGIQDSGGCHDVEITENIFQSLTGHAIKGIAGAGIATPLMNRYTDNYFNQCTNNIEIGASYSEFLRNRMMNTTTTKLKISAGGHNMVLDNTFEDALADIDNGHGYFGIATDVWRSFSKDTAAQYVGFATV